MNKNIVIASDHAGVELKATLKKHLVESGCNIEDCGTDGSESVDYPDYAHKLANFIAEHKDYIGILICGSGIGISMVANRFQHIRAALCTNLEMVELSRQHNDANVLVLGARFISDTDAKKFVDKFLITEFEGGRHANRVAKINR